MEPDYKYTFIGRIGTLAQILSYEISYIFIILTLILFILSYSLDREFFLNC